MKKLPIIFAILAALTYAISTPINKLLMNDIPSTLLASLLYLGAGIGMIIIYFILKITNKMKDEESLNKKDTPYVILMIVLDILAPILLLLGLSKSKANVIALLNNFEIIATSLIALLFFKEKILKNVRFGIIFITLASILLSVDFSESITLNFGAIYALLASICWGLENNCTRKISNKNPFQIVILKGIFSGLGSLIVALILKEKASSFLPIIYALLLGFVSIGLSVFFYVLAQRNLGASKTSCYYALTPFIATFLSCLIFKELPNIFYFIALFLMIIGVYFVSFTKKSR